MIAAVILAAIHFNTDLLSDLNRQGALGDAGDPTVKAAAGDDPVTGSQVFDHLFVFLGFFLLGADQQKIKDNEH